MTEIFMVWGVKVGGALAVMAAFWIVGELARGALARIATKDSDRRDVLLLLGWTARAALLVCGVVVALGTVGVDVTAMVAGLGLTGFALGFALKDILSSAMAGLIILLARPYRSGQHIEVAGFSGIVQQIDLRYTHLRNDENKTFLVPNATILTSPVTVLPQG